MSFQTCLCNQEVQKNIWLSDAPATHSSNITTRKSQMPVFFSKTLWLPLRRYAISSLAAYILLQEQENNKQINTHTQTQGVTIGTSHNFLAPSPPLWLLPENSFQQNASWCITKKLLNLLQNTNWARNTSTTKHSSQECTRDFFTQSDWENPVGRISLQLQVEEGAKEGKRKKGRDSKR